MLKRLILTTFSAVVCTQFHPLIAQSQWSLNETPTYDQLIQAYKFLDEKHIEIELYALGPSDTDLPSYVCVINGAGDSTLTFEKCRKGTTVLINNAIHPGEPDGVNASLIWIEDWIKTGKKTKDLPCIAFIPAYNVGGMLRRGSYSRANQDGPEEYGFRGNTQNLDLNRDFIKMDSPNAKTFARIFHALDPDVFVDTHVSNGADYQYTLTYISPLKERMSPSQSKLMYDQMIPDISNKLKKKKWDLFPYVDLKEDTPLDGLVAFNDLPRYAMGYAGLFQTLAFTVETHMLKPFPQRVSATKDFIYELIEWTGANASKIELIRSQARSEALHDSWFSYGYNLTEKRDSIKFKGFQEIYPLSEVTGLPRLKYDRSQPYERFIPWFKTYASSDSIKIPETIFVHPSAKGVIENLQMNQILFSRTSNDTLIEVSTNKITAFKSLERPYEAHFYHQDVATDRVIQKVVMPKGTVIIPTRQKGIAFILSTLIPEAEDSYFRWNYFDSYLQQKEYFSSYVFEDKALELLKEDPELAAEFQKKKDSDAKFRESQWEQLFFIYKRSPYYEQTDHCLPVYFSY